MVLIHSFAETGSNDMGVNLRRGKIRMTQHGLKAAEVGSAFEKMSGEGVPYHVRRQIVEYAGFSAVQFDGRPECLARHGSAARGDEQMGRCSALQ
jgi:hypothetical protein